MSAPDRPALLRALYDHQLRTLHAQLADGQPLDKPAVEILQKLQGLVDAQPEADRLPDLLPLFDAFTAYVQTQQPELAPAVGAAVQGFFAHVSPKP